VRNKKGEIKGIAVIFQDEPSKQFFSYHRHGDNGSLE
jgi:hypothetical protein